MNYYETTITIKLEKKVKVRADNGDEAMDKIVDTFANTDLIDLNDTEIKSITTHAEKVCDDESDCDEDCEEYHCCSEQEFLFEELY